MTPPMPSLRLLAPFFVIVAPIITAVISHRHGEGMPVAQHPLRPSGRDAGEGVPACRGSPWTMRERAEALQVSLLWHQAVD
jgi:hypothetical protein